MSQAISRSLHFILVHSTGLLVLTAAQQVNARSDDDFVSPVMTLEDFRKARAAGDEAESFEEKARHWRHALSWQTDHIEWLKLAHKFAGSLKDEWHETGADGQAPHLEHPYYRESESVYREILDRFDHMDLYDKNGAETLWEDSLLVPNAAGIGLTDFPLFLSMMQDFHDRRVKDWLAEPMPVKRPEAAIGVIGRLKRRTYDQRVADWLERRTRACEGRVFSHEEVFLINGAVKRYAYRCREHNEDYNPLPGLADLAARYTAPDIIAAIHKYAQIESPPFPRVPVPAGKTVELTLHWTPHDQSVGPPKVDFDTGTVVTNRLGWSGRTQQSAWMKRGGLDLEVDYHWDQLMNVITFDLELIEVPESLWNEEPASWKELEAAEIEESVLHHGSGGAGQMQCRIPAGTELPLSLVFKTREGGVGLLQLTGVKELADKVREYEIRYRMIKPGELGR
jgi:hypothetical protein